MFEMLTGRVPFNGETTVAIAIKHIQEEMPSPKEFVPEIPSSVASIVLKCCQKSPDRRYQNMEELIADLKQSLINPEEDFVVNTDPDMEGGTRMISDEDMAQIKRKSLIREDGNTKNRIMTRPCVCVPIRKPCMKTKKMAKTKIITTTTPRWSV